MIRGAGQADNFFLQHVSGKSPSRVLRPAIGKRVCVWLRIRYVRRTHTARLRSADAPTRPPPLLPIMSCLFFFLLFFFCLFCACTFTLIEAQERQQARLDLWELGWFSIRSVPCVGSCYRPRHLFFFPSLLSCRVLSCPVQSRLQRRSRPRKVGWCAERAGAQGKQPTKPTLFASAAEDHRRRHRTLVILLRA